MTERKWTPGPWKVDAGYTAEIVTKSGLKVCSVWSEEDFGTTIEIDRSCVPDADYPANAHLIAAAPELYEALVDMVDAVEYMMNIGNENKETKEARAVLAKARGETNA